MRSLGPLIALTLASAGGCSGLKGRPFDPTLEGRELYLCCNVGFDGGFVTSDANYRRYRSGNGYIPRPILAAGTRVRVTKVGESAVAFQTPGSSATYTLTFAFGHKQLSAGQYFQRILLETNPLDAVRDVPAPIADAIREGRLVPGMTKDEALIARGYPPAHRTPSLAASEWLYYETGAFVDRVTFVDDRIRSVVLEPAPQ